MEDNYVIDIDDQKEDLYDTLKKKYAYALLFWFAFGMSGIYRFYLYGREYKIYGIAGIILYILSLIFKDIYLLHYLVLFLYILDIAILYVNIGSYNKQLRREIRHGIITPENSCVNINTENILLILSGLFLVALVLKNFL